jgi:transposase
VDLRKGYNGLCGLVQAQLGADVLQGGLFVFMSRTRRGCKVLMWDGTGLCIFSKRLHQGRFAPIWERTDGRSIELTASELMLFIEGCAQIGKERLSPKKIEQKSAMQLSSSS